MKDKDGENLDRMTRRTDSPFINEMLNRPLSPKFHLPQLESYDDSKDPLDHIESFKMLMLLQMTPDKVMCRALPTSLKGAARVWFNKIPLGTIIDFEQLNKGFVLHFIGWQRYKKPIGHLMQRGRLEAESVTHNYYNSSTKPKFYKNTRLASKIIEKNISNKLLLINT